MQRTVISVDPGLTGTGYASFEDGTLSGVGCVYPTKSEFRTMGLYVRSRYIADRIPQGDELVIEHMYASPKKGFAVNGIIKTSFLSGVIAARYPKVHTVYPSEWQRRGKVGMNSKEAAYAQVTERLGCSFVETLLADFPKHVTSHIVDAIGIGLWYVEKMDVL